MKEILKGIKNILEENVSELKTVKIGSITSKVFSYTKLPSAVITPVMKKSHNYPKLDRQDFTVEITVVAEKNSLNQDEDATNDVLDLADSITALLEDKNNLNLSGICDGKYLEYDVKFGTNQIENKKIFASIAVIKTTYYRHFFRDVQPSGN